MCNPGNFSISFHLEQLLYNSYAVQAALLASVTAS